MKLEKSFWEVITQTDNQVLAWHLLALMVPDDIKQEVVNAYNREAQIGLDNPQYHSTAEEIRKLLNQRPGERCSRSILPDN